MDYIENGGDAIQTYPLLATMEDKEEVAKLREALLRYCELDTLAMVKVLEKLRKECMTDDELEKISLENTKKLLLKWKNDKNIQELKEFYDTKSFSGILGVERREMSHSNFIAWILNDMESHNLGQFAIKQLLDLLLENGEHNIKKSSINIAINFNDLYKSLLLGTYKLEDISVIVEDPLKFGQNKGGRIDIIVSMSIKIKTGYDEDFSKEIYSESNKVNLIIENKVDSPEHNNQTEKYHDYYKKDNKYKNDLNIFVYLTPNDDKPENEQFIKISYQQIADNILERALNQDISDRVEFIINEYLLSLRKPSKKGQIMAVKSEEEELLKIFWDENSELLNTAFNILRRSDDSFNELYNATQEKQTRDNTKYNFNSLSRLSKSKLPLELVRKYIHDNADASLEDIRNKFGFSFSEVKSIKDANLGKPKLYDKLMLSNNEEIVVMNNCWSDNISKVISNARKLNYQIEEVN